MQILLVYVWVLDTVGPHTQIDKEVTGFNKSEEQLLKDLVAYECFSYQGGEGIVCPRCHKLLEACYK